MNGAERVIWIQLAQPNDDLGVGCDEDGPHIGPIRLLARTKTGLEPRWTGELDFVVGRALGRPVQFASKRRGLEAVADALDKGNLPRAMLITQFMWLPSLPDRTALDRAITAESLVKAGFNSDQPRDDRGRWAEEGGNRTPLASAPARETGFTPVQDLVIPQGVIPWLEQIRPANPLPMTPPFPGDIVVPPATTVPRTLDNPFPKDRGCRQEWEDAKRYCQRLDDEGKLGQGDYKEHGRYYEQCVRGQVSERCGGKPGGPGSRALEFWCGLRESNMNEKYSELDEARDCAARDPYRALRLEGQYIANNPEDSRGYFSRHLTWAKLRNYENALEDCCKAISISPKLNRYIARAEIYRALGDHAKALADLDHVRNADHERWLNSFGPHLRADSLARLGRLGEALSDAALIRDDHWMPEHDGLPGGTKQEFIAEIRRRAAGAKPSSAS